MLAEEKEAKKGEETNAAFMGEGGFGQLLVTTIEFVEADLENSPATNWSTTVSSPSKNVSYCR